MNITVKRKMINATKNREVHDKLMTRNREARETQEGEM